MCWPHGACGLTKNSWSRLWVEYHSRFSCVALKKWNIFLDPSKNVTCVSRTKYNRRTHVMLILPIQKDKCMDYIQIAWYYTSTLSYHWHYTLLVAETTSSGQPAIYTIKPGNLARNWFCKGSGTLMAMKYHVTCQAHRALVKRVQWLVRLFLIFGVNSGDRVFGKVSRIFILWWGSKRIKRKRVYFGRVIYFPWQKYTSGRKAPIIQNLQCVMYFMRILYSF